MPALLEEADVTLTDLVRCHARAILGRAWAVGPPCGTLGSDGAVADDHIARVHACDLPRRSALPRLLELEPHTGVAPGAGLPPQTTGEAAPVRAHAHAVNAPPV